MASLVVDLLWAVSWGDRKRRSWLSRANGICVPCATVVLAARQRRSGGVDIAGICPGAERDVRAGAMASIGRHEELGVLHAFFDGRAEAKGGRRAVGDRHGVVPGIGK